MIARYFAVAALVVGLIMPTAHAADAGNSIDNLEFSQQGALTLVKVTLRNALDRPPSSFSTSNPYRLAFDFPATTSNLDATVKKAGLGILQSTAVVQGEARTRLVLNLSGPVQHTTTLENNVFYISLTGPNLAAAPSMNSQSSLGQSREGSLEPLLPLVTNVDFQASSADLASVRIDLTDPNVLLDVKQQGANLVLFFPNTEIQKRLERRLDVRDFGTSVVTLTSNRIGKGTQITLVNRGEWDYSVRQLDTAVVLEVRRIKTDPNSLAGAKQLQGKVVSFNFTQPVPIGQMIGIFQDISGLNFMVMPGVTGEIQSLKMENTPVTVAIDVISRMYGLAFRRYGDIVIVGKADDLAKYDKEERERVTALEGLEPVIQESIHIRYRPAEEIVQALLGVAQNSTSNGTTTGQTQTTSPSPQPTAPQSGGNSPQQTVGGSNKSLISQRGSVTYDAVTNSVFVEETKSQLDKIRERVSVLDRPTRQVVIEARIVNATDSFTRSLGVKIGMMRNPAGTTLNGSLATSANGPSNLTGGTLPAGRVTQVSGGYNSDNGTKATDLVFNLLNSDQTRILQLELSASELDNTSKSVATPKILTQDGRQASITSGQNICFQMSGGINGPTTSCIDAATKLDVTPKINPDGKIQLKLYVNKGEPAANVGGVVTTNKREITTNVVVENGGTLVLGGVFEDKTTDIADRVPFLGDLPYVGFLFKSTTKQRDRTELLIFITPRIVSEDLVLQ